MAKLKKGQRKKLPASSFAYPAQRKYPIHDKSHARNALARASSSKTSGTYSHVAAAVNRKFPGMAKGKTKKTAARKRTTSKRRASGRKSTRRKR